MDEVNGDAPPKRKRVPRKKLMSDEIQAKAAADAALLAAAESEPAPEALVSPEAELPLEGESDGSPSPLPGQAAQRVWDAEDSEQRRARIRAAMADLDERRAEIIRIKGQLGNAKRALQEKEWDLALLVSAEAKRQGGAT
jgi:hypothetical protein